MPIMVKFLLKELARFPSNTALYMDLAFNFWLYNNQGKQNL